MLNILVTGAKGQLGLSIKKLSQQFPNLSFVYTDAETLDITNPEAIASYFNQNSFDYCVNCAAYTAVDKAETETELAYKINAEASKYLAEQCRESNTTFIHISTDFVFDGNVQIPYLETDTPKPLSVYGASKLKGEYYIADILETHFIIRTSWLYSEFGNNFMKTMIRLGKERDSLSVVNDQIGTPTYATDLAEVILKIIDHQSRKYGLYHFSNDGAVSWFEFAKTIFELSNIKIDLKAIPTTDYPTPAVRPKFSVLNKDKIKNSFNIEIKKWTTSLKTSLSNYDN
jgi:dTDP-4-dehydrorhamnose reductase